MRYSIKELLFWKIRGERPIKAYLKAGLTLGGNFSMEMGCTLDYDHCFLITIGDDVTLAPGVKILAHDASTKRSLGYTKIAKVNIGSRVFIGANSIILPGVTIGDDVIIGAGSVITKDVSSGSIVGGNPVRVIGYTEAYIKKNKDKMKEGNTFDSSYTLREGVSDIKKEELKDKIGDDIGFVE
ncbi:DapH/DapD/GlmU-related protein [Clostridium sp.]|uniref:DapH/DapD/GlmU-related protein n=1 Tax=Clostridium sp. TaxID=1506 RepID=UPI00346410C7